MNDDITCVERVIGFDSHPDTFAAAILRGPTPAAAQVEKLFNKVPIEQLVSWAKKHTSPKDLLVLEASGNSFHVVRVLAKVRRRALVLESCQMGKLKEAHANNDKISAVRIGKAYLAGTAKVVWLPDPKTQERRDLFHTHRKAVRRSTQMRNRILSYLSDNGVRLPRGVKLVTKPAVAEQQLRSAKEWTFAQWKILEGLLMDLRHAEQQRKHWRSLIAHEVVSDPLLLSIVRLCGVRDIIAFALGAIIGDIKRFATPGKLVKYIGFDPAFDESGKGEWRGGIAGHGRNDLRSLLIESAQAIIRTRHRLGQWGRQLAARKGSMKLAVGAIGRKLTVAIWYLMMGRWTPLEEIDHQLSIKVGKIITEVGKDYLKQAGKKRKDFRQEIIEALKRGRTYTLDLEKKFVPKVKAASSLTEENGLSQ
jgi:transposase